MCRAPRPVRDRRSPCRKQFRPHTIRPSRFSSHQRGQAVEFAAKSERRIRVVIPHEFVGKVGSQPKRSAERENLKRTGGTMEGCAARDVKEERSLRTDGTKLEVCTSSWPMGCASPGLCSTRDRVVTTRVPRLGTDGTVLAVPDVTRAEFVRCCRRRWAGPRRRSADSACRRRFHSRRGIRCGVRSCSQCRSRLRRALRRKPQRESIR